MNLRTDFQDAVWQGRRKFRMINNPDGTVSFDDVTEYSQVENSFFSANDANAVDEAVNTLSTKVSGANLLDNPWFTVNQRGITAYTVGSYGVDRWKLISGSATVASNGEITLNGTLRQILEFKPEGLVTASVRTISGTANASYDASTGYFDIATSETAVIRAAKLETGAKSTLDVDFEPNYSEELVKCQRYFVQFATVDPFGYGYVGATLSKLYLAVPTPCEMRDVTPVITGYANIRIKTPTDSSISVTALTSAAVGSFGITMTLTLASSAGTKGACGSWVSGIFAISCDF